MKIVVQTMLGSLLSAASLFAGNEDFFARIEPFRSRSIQVRSLKKQQVDVNVTADDLRYVTFYYWSEDGRLNRGTVVVHKDIAGQVVEYFYRLFEESHAVQRTHLLESFFSDAQAARTR